MKTDSTPIKVLFVCTGNICRSPLAEGLFNAYLHEHGLNHLFIVDSAGTSSYHIGELADRRAREVAKHNDTVLTHRARQFVAADFREFDYILVMDHLNYDSVIAQAQNKQQQNKVLLFRTFDSTSPDYYEVPDPYYGAAADFADVGEIIKRATVGFIQYLKENKIL